MAAASPITISEKFQESCEESEKTPHYLEKLCLNETGYGASCDHTKDHYLEGVFTHPNRSNLKKVCVLPKGHTGKCSINYNCLFKDNDEAFTKKLQRSIDAKIYRTPGNDDYVFKNRANRLHKNPVCCSVEKQMRDKTIKKSCTIPLAEASTPILLAQAYLDWMTFIMSTKGIEEYLNVDHPLFDDVRNLIEKNKKYLQDVVYSNTEIFSPEGYSICVISGDCIELEDIADPSRDIRVNIRPTDIQLGHNEPRSDEYVTIRGGNLLPMSRCGNLILGDNTFTKTSEWLPNLMKIVIRHLPSLMSHLGDSILGTLEYTMYRTLQGLEKIVKFL